VSRDASPVMMFSIKKRMYTKLFIDRTEALYVQNGGSRDNIKVKCGGSTIGTVWSPDQEYVASKNKICGNEKPGRQPVSKLH